MIGVIDVAIQAQNPAAPLWPMRAYVGSPSSIRVRNVPKKIGEWCINKVTFVANYPDNTTQSVECKLVGGVYVGTIDGASRAGKSSEGYSIVADGVNESGSAVAGYILGKGDIEILANTSDVTPSDAFYNVHLLSAESATPKAGDMWLSGDTLNIVNTDNQISTIGGGVPSNLSVDTLTAGMLSAAEAHVEFINFFDGQNGSSLAYQLSQIPYKPIVQYNLGYASTPQTVTVQPFAVNVIIPHDENNITIDFDGVDFSGGKAIDTIIVVNCAFSMPASFAWTYAFMYMGETNLTSGYRNVFTLQQISGGDMIVRRDLY